MHPPYLFGLIHVIRAEQASGWLRPVDTFPESSFRTDDIPNEGSEGGSRRLQRRVVHDDATKSGEGDLRTIPSSKSTGAAARIILPRSPHGLPCRLSEGVLSKSDHPGVQDEDLRRGHQYSVVSSKLATLESNFIRPNVLGLQCSPHLEGMMKYLSSPKKLFTRSSSLSPPAWCGF